MSSWPGDDTRVDVRLADSQDMEYIVALSQQLGYPASQEQMERRFRKIQPDARHAVYVAEGAEGCVIGWVHVFVRKLLVADERAEIGGLVVDERYRRRGVGWLLMREAEQWARAKGCTAVCLRSNVVRTEAHQFYEGIGYRKVKTQGAFCKDL